MCCVCNMNTEQARVMLIGKTKIIQEQKEHSGFLRIELPGASARTEENVGIRGGQDQVNLFLMFARNSMIQSFHLIVKGRL